MELTISQRRTGNGSCALLGMLMMVAFLAAYAVISYSQHAVIKHGADAQQVRSCMESRGPTQTWVKRNDGRVIYVCQVGPQKWGLMITDGTHEVTSFVKEKLRFLHEVERYLRNIGAEKLIQ